MVDEVIFPADHEFPAGRFDHPELRQLAKALPAVLLLDRAAITVATYLRAYNACIIRCSFAGRSWCSRCASTDLVSVFGEFCSVRCELGIERVVIRSRVNYPVLNQVVERILAKPA